MMQRSGWFRDQHGIVLAPAIRAIRAGTVRKGESDPHRGGRRPPGREAGLGGPAARPPGPDHERRRAFTIDGDRVECTCEVEATYKTGVEMEALTA